MFVFGQRNSGKHSMVPGSTLPPMLLCALPVLGGLRVMAEEGVAAVGETYVY